MKYCVEDLDGNEVPDMVIVYASDNDLPDSNLIKTFKGRIVSMIPVVDHLTLESAESVAQSIINSFKKGTS